ncbi:MAG: hypothetical protein II735_09005 [Clostridia bacterium]|nr:hypothetical protein [Clostridia bacterium]
MPFINTKVNVSISQEQEQTLKTQFGKAIALIGKSESWLMLNFEDNGKLWFKGSDSPAAIAEVSLYGRASAASYDALTARLTEILSTVLGITPGRIYVKYSEIEYWGMAGSNF